MSLSACASLVERGDPDRFLATMAAPPAARQVLFPIHAFALEVARAPWVTHESMIAEMRLQWWRDALTEIAEDRPVRRHEVTTPLAALLTPELAAQLDAVVAVRRWDIYREPFEDDAHFARYIDQTSGTPVWAAAHLLGQQDEGPIRDIAWAGGVANYLRAVPALEQAGRIPLLDGTPAGLRALARRALARLDGADRGRIGPAARPALLPFWQARRILRQVVRDPARVALGTLGQSEARRRLSLMRVSVTGRI